MVDPFSPTHLNYHLEIRDFKSDSIWLNGDDLDIIYIFFFKSFSIVCAIVYQFEVQLNVKSL